MTFFISHSVFFMVFNSVLLFAKSYPAFLLFSMLSFMNADSFKGFLILV